MADDNSKFIDFTQKPDFQQILTNPILDIAARFWEDDRYDAFRTCYRSMRIIDDLIDERKAADKRISDEEKKQMVLSLTMWADSLLQNKPRDDFQKKLIDTVEHFRIPTWPWQRLLKAMLYDLDHDGFASLRVFLRYCEGAAIAPASIFMHLCGVRKQNGHYVASEFDIRRAARPLALFSYLVHIIRDFQKDHTDGLNYFAEDIMRNHDLNAASLKNIAAGGNITPGFRNLVGHYHRFAGYYRKLARNTVDQILPVLDPPYQLSLEIIYNLYLQIYERIDIANGRFTTDELNPSPAEIQDRIYDTVSTFKPAN